MIKQHKIDEAANDFAVRRYGVPAISTSNLIFDQGVADYKAGCNFAIRELKIITIEFAEWILNNKFGFVLSSKGLVYTPNNMADSTTYTPTELYELFIKERGNISNG